MSSLVELNGPFNERLNEGDLVRFVTEGGRQKVGFYLSEDGVKTFSRNYPKTGRRGECFEIYYHEFQTNKNILKADCESVEEGKEVATHYEIISRNED
jgi:hypothetical protein